MSYEQSPLKLAGGPVPSIPGCTPEQGRLLSPTPDVRRGLRMSGLEFWIRRLALSWPCLVTSDFGLLTPERMWVGERTLKVFLAHKVPLEVGALPGAAVFFLLRIVSRPLNCIYPFTPLTRVSQTSTMYQVLYEALCTERCTDQTCLV